MIFCMHCGTLSETSDHHTDCPTTKGYTWDSAYRKVTRRGTITGRWVNRIEAADEASVTVQEALPIERITDDQLRHLLDVRAKHVCRCRHRRDQHDEEGFGNDCLICSCDGFVRENR